MQEEWILYVIRQHYQLAGLINDGEHTCVRLKEKDMSPTNTHCMR